MLQLAATLPIARSVGQNCDGTGRRSTNTGLWGTKVHEHPAIIAFAPERSLRLCHFSSTFERRGHRSGASSDELSLTATIMPAMCYASSEAQRKSIGNFRRQSCTSKLGPGGRLTPRVAPGKFSSWAPMAVVGITSKHSRPYFGDGAHLQDLHGTIELRYSLFGTQLTLNPMTAFHMRTLTRMKHEVMSGISEPERYWKLACVPWVAAALASRSVHRCS